MKEISELGEFVMFLEEWLWNVIVPICQMAVLAGLAVLKDQKVSTAFEVQIKMQMQMQIQILIQIPIQKQI